MPSLLAKQRASTQPKVSRTLSAESCRYHIVNDHRRNWKKDTPELVLLFSPPFKNCILNIGNENYMTLYHLSDTQLQLNLNQVSLANRRITRQKLVNTKCSSHHITLSKSSNCTKYCNPWDAQFKLQTRCPDASVTVQSADIANSGTADPVLKSVPSNPVRTLFHEDYLSFRETPPKTPPDGDDVVNHLVTSFSDGNGRYANEWCAGPSNRTNTSPHRQDNCIWWKIRGYAQELEEGDRFIRQIHSIWCTKQCILPPPTHSVSRTRHTATPDKQQGKVKAIGEAMKE